MSNIVLSADATCDLSDELKEKYQVEYFPYHIIFKGKDYVDNVNIHTDEIFEEFYKNKTLPKTAASSPGIFTEYFKQFTDQGKQVIHFSLASSLSSSCNNATMAANAMDNVYVVDSQNLSSATGLQVIEAGKLISQGKSIEEIYDNALQVRKRAHASFVLDTMDFLAAGGRCPAIASQIGKALNFKLQISVHNNDGSMSPGKLYRGPQSKVVSKYMMDQLNKYNDIVQEDVFITSTGFADKKLLGELVEIVQEKLPDATIHKSNASCTISSHCGPGCIGVLFLTESECE